MPELPDIVLYLEALRPRVEGQILERVRLLGPFLLRSVEPPISEAMGNALLACGDLENGSSLRSKTTCFWYST